MTSGWVFLVTLVSTLGGAVLGAVLRRWLPAAHLNTETREVIRLGVGLLATLSAVAISLMIASAKTSYDTQDAHFRQFSADVILTDQLLAQYGPEASGIRKLMRQAIPAALDRIWAEKAIGAPQGNAFTTSSAAEQIYDAIEALSPVDDAQRLLKPRIERASGDIARARLLMFADVDTPIQRPFLLILVFWLTVIFVSFSLFVEPGPVLAVALLVFALSISSALFLVADLSRPFAGLMQISNQSLRDALGPLN
ncbi:MAG TPA: hypothetical protein VGL45_03545 [Bradyrhizobium sp.]